MHELGLAEGILSVVLGVSEGREVQRIVVRAGTFQAVDADSLAFSFELVADGTRAAHASLEVLPAADDALTVEEVECAGAPPLLIRRPGLEVVEAPHSHQPDPDAAVHRHPAWR